MSPSPATVGPSPDPPRSIPEGLAIRDLRAEDLEGVVAIDALRTGARKPEYWKRVFRETLDPEPELVRVGLAAERAGEAVRYVTERLQDGRFTPKISKTFPLSKAVEAYQYLESNQQIGKIVITVP